MAHVWKHNLKSKADYTSQIILLKNRTVVETSEVFPEAMKNKWEKS